MRLAPGAESRVLPGHVYLTAVPELFITAHGIDRVPERTGCDDLYPSCRLPVHGKIEGVS